MPEPTTFCLSGNPVPTMSPLPIEDASDVDAQSAQPACVLVFNANDPSGAGGLACDINAIASVGAHALPVVTGAYTRDTAEIVDHHAMSDDAVREQGRTILEDVSAQVFKIGFCGSPENLSAIAEITSDYADVPVIAYMPDLSWWSEVQIDLYLDAFRELILPQTTVLVGNHSTLWRWLLPDWNSDKYPTPRDIARAANEMGVPYTLVTGIIAPEQQIENVLASPQSVLYSERFEHFEATFAGAGDTLSAALAALLASGSDLAESAKEALGYLDRCLEAGFRPGMGHIVPDRLFWAQPESDDEDDVDDAQLDTLFDLPAHDTKH